MKNLILFICASLLTSCGTERDSSREDASQPVKVTPENFIRAATDQQFYMGTQAVGINQFLHFTSLTPLDQQMVVRMNRDVLYSAAVVDVEDGATVTFPEIPDGRYASILMVDNDHYSPGTIYEPGIHELPQDTKYLFVAVRIQLLNPNDSADIAKVNELQKQFVINANSADDFPEPRWEQKSLDSLRTIYEKEFSSYKNFPSGWMGPRGSVDEETRHLAAAGGWGLFPNKDAKYINYNGGNLSGDKCYVATYEVPDVGAFWSITVYGNDGFMKHENNIINQHNVVYNEDSTFTVHYGSEANCPDAKNRLDITDGWNFLMRAYLPGETVLNGTYQLPEVVEVN